MRYLPRFLAPAAAAAYLVVQTFAPAAAAPAPGVVFIGGLGTTPASTHQTFMPLARQLAPLGYEHVFSFDYGASAAASCQPIEASTAALAAYVRDLRDRGLASSVVLVGHSDGGVVALGALADAPDLAPFVARVVTVDAPLGGISLTDALIYGVAKGPCSAADELYHRYQSPDWPEAVGNLAALDRWLGTDVRVVVNAEDVAVLPSEQQIPGDVAYILSATDPNDFTNHSAALEAPAAAQLAAIVAGQ
jgi:pimeloyl-ACP methyl ester carboxylesterase